MMIDLRSKIKDLKKRIILDTFRARLARKVPPGVSLVDELLAERREEATRE